MLVMHGIALPSLFDAVGSTDSGAYLSLITRITGLSLSAGFFILKLFDVPWLRMRGGWRGAVVAVLILGMIHVGVIDRMVGDEMGLDPAHMPWLMATFILGSVLLLAELHDAMLRRFPGSISAGELQPDPRARAVEDAWLPFTSRVVPLYAAPRAPPAR